MKIIVRNQWIWVCCLVFIQKVSMRSNLWIRECSQVCSQCICLWCSCHTCCQKQCNWSKFRLASNGTLTCTHCKLLKTHCKFSIRLGDSHKKSTYWIRGRRIDRLSHICCICIYLDLSNFLSHWKPQRLQEQSDHQDFQLWCNWSNQGMPNHTTYKAQHQWGNLSDNHIPKTFLSFLSILWIGHIDICCPRAAPVDAFWSRTQDKFRTRSSLRSRPCRVSKTRSTNLCKSLSDTSRISQCRRCRSCMSYYRIACTIHWPSGTP